MWKRDKDLWGFPDVSEGCTAQPLLLTSGYQNAPEPTHTTCYTHKRRHRRKPLCRDLVATIGAGAGQAYYSYPQGVVSLLTGRHKYSSTSSPRVNGCPSGNNEMYRAACAWRRRTHRHTQRTSTFGGIARSLMEMGGEKRGGQEAAWDSHECCASACLHGHWWIDFHKGKTKTTHTHEVST